MRITETYKKLNMQLFETGAFGISGHRWAGVVEHLVKSNGFNSILDYGAGKETLKESLTTLVEVDFESYDPCVENLAGDPSPADLVTCTDVLEHVEEECIDDVLDHLKQLAKKQAFLVIPTGPAKKTLADGRNAHVTQKPLEWWLPKILERFYVITISQFGSSIILVLAANKTHSRLLSQVRSLLGEALLNHRILAMSFDGVTIHLAVKSKSLAQRIVPKLISLISFGMYKGLVTKKVLGDVRLTLITTKF
jgi:hypothetical protein